MTVYQYPESGTQLYASQAEALWNITEWMIGTGVFTEVKSGDGTTGPAPGNVTSQSDYANAGSYRVLRASDGSEVALQRVSSTNILVLVALAPGFVTGGSGSVVPTAADECEIFGSGNRTTGETFAWNLASQTWHLLIDDGYNNTVGYAIRSYQSGGTPRFMLERAVQYLRYPADTTDEDKALYTKVTQAGIYSTVWRDVDGTWRTSSTERVLFSVTPGTLGASRNYLAPFIVEQGSPLYIKGPFAQQVRCHSNSNAEELMSTSRGWWITYNGKAHYMGENQPSVPGVSVAAVQAYELAPPGEGGYVRSPPTVTKITTGDIQKHQEVQLLIEDETAIEEIGFVMKTASGYAEGVCSGETFYARYAKGSSIVQTNVKEWTVTLKRSGGWPEGDWWIDAVVVDGN